jgi:T5SS/PEP-CTERM-associated repeat protein
LVNLFAALNARSQLVADGQTNVLDGVTNSISGNSTVGSSGSYTLLVLTNGAVVTNVSGSLNIGANAAAQSNQVVISGTNSFWKAASFYVGQSGSASELQILNGGTANTGSGYIGQQTSSSNNLVLVSDPGSTWLSGGLTLGPNGSANTLIVSNGSHVAGGNGATVGGFSTSFSNNVFITGTGSEWDCGGPTYIGYSSSRLNNLTVNDGAKTIVSGAFEIGYMANSNKVLLTDNGSILQCQSFRIGHSGVGNECVVSNSAQLIVPSGTQSSVEGDRTKMKVTGSGSTVTNLNTSFYFGQSSNTLEISDGGILVDNTGYFEKGPGTPANAVGFDTAIVAGTNSLWQNLGSFYVGTLNQQLLVTNGGVLADNFGYVGHISADGTNYVLISGAGSSWINTNDLTVGTGVGMCRLYVADAAKVNANNLNVAGVANKTLVVVSNSGVVLLGNNLAIGNVSTKSNTVTISGGAIIVSNRVSLTSYGVLNLNSGTLRANSLAADTGGGSGSRVNFTGGNLQLGATDYRFQNPFTIGDGTNTAVFEMLTGGTHIFAALVVSSNAFLKGVGTIATAPVSIKNGGTLAPGTTALGTITINGNLVLSAGSTNIMKLDATSGTADSLTGMASVTFGGTLQLGNLTGSLAAGNSFKLFTATNYFGAFANLSPASPGPGLSWNTNQLNINGVLGVSSTATPAPNLAVAMAVGGNIVLSTTGGVSFTPCYLLTCTNFPPLPADWTYVSTNYFDASGATGFTNAIQADEKQRYFRIQVN